ncbi:MAG: TolC family protein, partial [Nitrospinae bacterium]|nr:TolC family protein [Nitrospinota bacterium]
RVAVKLAEEKLKAEEKKFKVGLSTSFNVLQFQEDLAKEQSNQIKAVIDYNKTLIKLRQAMSNTLERHNIQLSTRTMGK